MKLGLLADIHEDVERLELAIARLRALGAERFVMLGDVFDRGDAGRLDAVAALLDGVGAAGVWGNHDYGLSVDPGDLERRRYTPRTLDCMARLCARLEIDGCLFSHIEPRLDPNRLEDLWDCGEHPDTPGRVDANFAAAPQRLMVMGHNHRWILARPGEVLAWEGECPVRLDPPSRYLVVVHAVADGWCAMLDTGAHLLTPVNLEG